MAQRDPKNQQEHDTLVEMIARKIHIPTWIVTTNPGAQQNAGIPYPAGALTSRADGQGAAQSKDQSTKIPTWTLATNPGPAQNAGVSYPTEAGQALAYPDMVMHEKFTRKLAAVGEVETAGSVTAEEAETEWALFSRLAPKFFLYVPAELEPEARDLLRRRRIRPEGLFLYRFTERNMFVVARAK
jgi:hypothetical protein